MFDLAYILINWCIFYFESQKKDYYHLLCPPPEERLLVVFRKPKQDEEYENIGVLAFPSFTYQKIRDIGGEIICLI